MFNTRCHQDHWHCQREEWNHCQEFDENLKKIMNNSLLVTPLRTFDLHKEYSIVQLCTVHITEKHNGKTKSLIKNLVSYPRMEMIGWTVQTNIRSMEIAWYIKNWKYIKGQANDWLSWFSIIFRKCSENDVYYFCVTNLSHLKN